MILQDEEELYNLIKEICKKHDTDKIVLSGGDPLYPANREIVKNFLNKYGSLYDICIYRISNLLNAVDMMKLINKYQRRPKTISNWLLQIKTFIMLSMKNLVKTEF